MLSVDGLTKRFSGLVAVDDASLVAPAGKITGLIGPNGAGKTTLFAMAAGFLTPDAGKVTFAGEDVTAEPPHLRARRGMARTFQIVQPFAGLTVRENIAVGAHLHHPSRAEALERADAIGRRVGLEKDLDRAAAGLTVAGRKRLELARALATEPKLLLLDEVLAGLNPSEIRDILPVIRAIRLMDGRYLGWAARSDAMIFSSLTTPVTRWSSDSSTSRKWTSPSCSGTSSSRSTSASCGRSGFTHSPPASKRPSRPRSCTATSGGSHVKSSSPRSSRRMYDVERGSNSSHLRWKSSTCSYVIESASSADASLK